MSSETEEVKEIPENRILVETAQEGTILVMRRGMKDKLSIETTILQVPVCANSNRLMSVMTKRQAKIVLQDCKWILDQNLKLNLSKDTEYNVANDDAIEHAIINGGQFIMEITDDHIKKGLVENLELYCRDAEALREKKQYELERKLDRRRIEHTFATTREKYEGSNYITMIQSGTQKLFGTDYEKYEYAYLKAYLDIDAGSADLFRMYTKAFIIVMTMALPSDSVKAELRYYDLPVRSFECKLKDLEEGFRKLLAEAHDRAFPLPTAKLWA